MLPEMCIPESGRNPLLCLPCEKIISVTIASIVTSDSAYKTIRVLFPIPLLLFFLLKYTNSCMFFLSCSSYHIVIKKTKIRNFLPEMEGILMITTSELLQLMSLLISVAGLFYLIGKDNHGRKNNRPGQGCGYFYNA